MELWFYLAIPILLLTAWFYTAAVVRTRFPMLRDKAVLLLIAHPDDEAMFFAPTVLGLSQPELGNHVKILCLSNGNADGLGAVRAKEIQESAVRLGLRSKDDVAVVDDLAKFPDSMSMEWSAVDIAALLNAHFLKPAAKGNRKYASTAAGKDAPPATTIDVLITFDASGVSGHINHRSLYHGAVAWVRGLVKGRSGWEGPVALYTLTSVNIVRKYVGLLDAPGTAISSVFRSFGSRRRDFPDWVAFLSDGGQYWKARGAMTTAHKSQMAWFRWGWITVGRYMYVNDLKRVNVR